MKTDKTRLGKILFTEDFYLKGDHEIECVFCDLKLKITNVAFDYVREQFVWTCISPFFESIKEGEIIPTYDITLSKKFSKIHIKEIKRI